MFTYQVLHMEYLGFHSGRYVYMIPGCQVVGHSCQGPEGPTTLQWIGQLVSLSPTPCPITHESVTDHVVGRGWGLF